MEPEITRREFLKASGGAVAAAGLGVLADSRQAEAAPRGRRVAPSEKIVLGFIGVAGRGSGHLDGFGRYPDVVIGAVCDVYEAHRERAVQKTGGKARGYHDFRKLLEQKEIDAVVVATPPHWHPLITIAACQAGKDVYCEKPMSRYPAEAQAMVKAARENGCVTQVGTQIHATENYHRAVEIVRSGVLGKIHVIRNICTMNEYPQGLGRPPDSAPPPGLDWDFWLGPAPKVPFNTARFVAGQHRYFKDYVGSWLDELGPHIVDLPFWAMELPQPTAVSASGGRFVARDVGDIPDTMDVAWEFPNLTMTWTHTAGNGYHFDFGGPPDGSGGRRLGVMFHGTEGTLLADYDTVRIVAEGQRMKDVTLPAPSLPRSPGHEREFLDAVKSRKQPSCNFEAHLPLHVALNLAHVALKTGRKLRWDAEKFQVVGDREASARIVPEYRAPWMLPGPG